MLCLATRNGLHGDHSFKFPQKLICKEVPLKRGQNLLPFASLQGSPRFCRGLQCRGSRVAIGQLWFLWITPRTAIYSFPMYPPKRFWNVFYHYFCWVLLFHTFSIFFGVAIHFDTRDLDGKKPGDSDRQGHLRSGWMGRFYKLHPMVSPARPGPKWSHELQSIRVTRYQPRHREFLAHDSAFVFRLHVICRYICDSGATDWRRHSNWSVERSSPVGL